MNQTFQSVLKAAGYSATKPRALVFEQLAKNGPLSPALLADHCAGRVDRATVYRTIALFEHIGICQRIWHGFKSQLELSELFTPHHHHAVCQSCGATLDIVSPQIETLLEQIARQHHFLAKGHSIELLGYCESCQ